MPPGRHFIKPAISAAVFVLLAISTALAPARGAGATGRRLLVINAGNEAIFSVRIGHAATGQWSADLLNFSAVIDVSRGVEVSLAAAPADCTLDVEAAYGDGDTQVVPAVNLCTAAQIRFDH
jgi:hypothetical protein